MNQKLEKVFNHWTLLAINIILIAAVELTDLYFARTGLIHLIALIFIFLGASRIWVHYDVYDPYLKPFLYAGILSLIVFATSHILEYSSFRYLHLNTDAILANVVNMYLTGMLLIILGIEYFLRKMTKSSSIIVPFAVAGVAACQGFVVAFVSNSKIISLGRNDPELFVYIGAIILVFILGVARLSALKRRVSIMVNFINYFIAVFFMLSFAAIVSICGDVLGAWGVASYRAMYLSHFFFYGAASLIFLAYVRLVHLGGVYESLKKGEK